MEDVKLYCNNVFYFNNIIHLNVRKNMEDSEPLKGHVLAVEESYRIRLPQPLCQEVVWIMGKQISAWLLLCRSDRCRLLSASEVENDPDLKLLRARVTEKRAEGDAGPFEFQDAASVVLRLRLLQIQLNRHETSGWRFTLPRPIAAIMQLRPSESSLIALIVQDHIELWTVEAMRSAVDIPLADIL
jgi:hypothetical protein